MTLNCDDVTVAVVDCGYLGNIFFCPIVEKRWQKIHIPEILIDTDLAEIIVLITISK